MDFLLKLMSLLGGFASTAEQASKTDEANRRTDAQIEEAMRIARERASTGLAMYDDDSQESLTALLGANRRLEDRTKSLQDQADRLPGQYQADRMSFLKDFNNRNLATQRGWGQGVESFLEGQAGEDESILEGYRDRYRRAEEDLKGYGEQQEADIDRRFDDERGQVEQQLINSGLISSTQAGHDFLGVTERRSAEQRRSADDLIRNRLNFLTGLSGEELSARERLGGRRAGYQWGGMQGGLNLRSTADAATAAYDAAMRGDVNTARQLALQYGHQGSATRYAADTNRSNWYGTNASNRSNLYMGGMGDILNTLMNIQYVPPPPNQLPYQLGQLAVDPAEAPGFDWKSLLGPSIGAGGAIAGGAAAAGWYPTIFAGLSDPGAKTDIVPINDKEILEGVRRVPIRAWRYRGDGDRHVGPMADAFNSAFGLGSKTHIPFVDAIGVLWAAVQALSDKLDAVAK